MKMAGELTILNVKLAWPGTAEQERKIGDLTAF